MSKRYDDPDRSLRMHLVGGLACLALLGGGVGVWAATTDLAGAVIAPGTVVAAAHVKTVQHPTGGVVGEILVREGERIEAGQVVLRLDRTVAAANLAAVAKQLDELAARHGRLQAERDGADAITIASELGSRAAEPRIAGLIAGEERLFRLRRGARDGQVSQLLERIAQLEQEIEGLQIHAGAKEEEIALIGEELSGIEELRRKNLVPLTRLIALQREKARLTGERGQLLATRAQAQGRISETELQIIQIDQDLRSQAAQELRNIEARASDLEERRITAQDQLERVEIRAPEGVVHALTVHTVGGVIVAGESLMMVVPDTGDLAIEVRVAPQDIDQVRLGQQAVLRLTAFNQRTTPEIRGRVSRVGADLSRDAGGAASHYVVRITAEEADEERMRDLELVSGMPVEAFIQTGARTALSYLVKPLTDQMTRAFREE